MIDASTYRARRDVLRQLVQDDGSLIVLVGHQEQPRNYPHNPYPFRQSSHLLYYSGCNLPNLVLIVGANADEDRIYAPAADIDDVVWYGPRPSLEETAAAAGIGTVEDISKLAEFCASAAKPFHYLDPVQASVADWMAGLFNCSVTELRAGVSGGLKHAIADQRSKKTADEIAEIEEALGVTRAMHVEAMRVTRPGILEAEVAAAAQAVALAKDRQQAYNPIITVHGEVLHNHMYHHRLESGQLLLNDSGAESPLGYSSDITRTTPVDGRFTTQQREIYDIVLKSQLTAIDTSTVGTPYLDVHLTAARVLAEGLTELGLMKGSAEEAVALGAHALFFPHGTGHMLGLDVHDMEDIGEDVVGYGPGRERSTQFGLNALRLAKELEAGNVFTIEPGIYFIPALIDRWKSEGLHADFINYDALESYREFGGVRIEDDILTDEKGPRVLGPAIPRTPDEVEAAAQA